MPPGFHFALIQATALNEDPSHRNLVMNMGGIGVGGGMTAIGTRIALDVGPVLTRAVVSNPEMLLTSAAIIGLGTVGFFAGKVIANGLYNLENWGQDKVETWYQNYGR